MDIYQQLTTVNPLLAWLGLTRAKPHSSSSSSTRTHTHTHTEGPLSPSSFPLLFADILTASPLHFHRGSALAAETSPLTSSDRHSHTPSAVPFSLRNDKDACTHVPLVDRLQCALPVLYFFTAFFLDSRFEPLSLRMLPLPPHDSEGTGECETQVCLCVCEFAPRERERGEREGEREREKERERK